LLNLNCNSFRIHRSFIFVTFNVMQRLEPVWTFISNEKIKIILPNL
jgi:hypothetical protein